MARSAFLYDRHRDSRMSLFARRAAREQLGPFGVGQAEIIGDRAAEGSKRPFAAVGGATEEREKDLVELGNGHAMLG